MWDYMALAGTLMLAPALVPILLNRRAFVPRSTSLPTVLGLSLLVLPMVNSGLVLTSVATLLTTMMWCFIAIFRGKETT